eukprot:COSAG04_NODE_17133_length_478_cov_0.984169_2_plen_40_part_01
MGKSLPKHLQLRDERLRSRNSHAFSESFGMVEFRADDKPD